MFIDDKVSVVVTRGVESWQFFAFVFAATCGLGLSVIEDLVRRPPLRIPIKLAWFLCTFYCVMVNAWVGNRLVTFLTWLKHQPQ